METKTLAFSATVQIGLSIAIEGYHLQDGTFRYGSEYVSRLLGYAGNYLLHLSKNSKKKLKTLRERGYTDEQISLKVFRSGRGASCPKSISFDDLCILVEYEAIEVKNPQAIALLTASFREMLRNRTQEAFGLTIDSLEQRVVQFEEDYQNSLESDDLTLYGDEELVQDSTWWGKLATAYDVDVDERCLHLNYEG